MRTGESFPDNQAEIVFNDVFIEYLEKLSPGDRESVLSEVVGLCARPVGTHPLSNRSSKDQLAGWNTVTVLNTEHRVVFGSRVEDGVGVVEVLCAGPRRADAAYDLANALIQTGRLSEDESNEIWQALALLDIVAEDVGLDGWDYRPPAAPEGMVRAAVAAGVLDEAVASVLRLDELQAAMSEGWGPGGPDPARAVQAALRQARAGVEMGDVTRILAGRAGARCGVVLPRKKERCLRSLGHPGAHRSTI